MKIYIVTWGIYDDEEIVGVYSSWGAAYQKANDWHKTHLDSGIYVWDLDGNKLFDYLRIVSMEPNTDEAYQRTGSHYYRYVNPEYCEQRDPTEVQP